ncbi:serine/threonine-protein phosphatase 6 regulatory ankyrin repeat subunit B-like [Uloborus diversus]|uniref:serine/threonine-protein phosphatase 6 regulatory ankyrin repeat subunit B-like n=1 Tax=Uloborus diversus TaxID=327109 RepID=UPI00240A09A1|nr:serine/threonine-protein phosphatase 6 regulatory ankyrin repeat subunit B-like [Uloborus diversus]
MSLREALWQLQAAANTAVTSAAANTAVPLAVVNVVEDMNTSASTSFSAKDELPICVDSVEMADEIETDPYEDDWFFYEKRPTESAEEYYVRMNLLFFKASYKVSSETDGSSLHKAAKAGDSRRVKKLLAAGFSTRLQDRRGRTPLLLALEHNNEEAAEALLDADGKNNNAQDKNGMTALHWAAMYECMTVLEKLLTLGVDARLQDREGRTALHLALIYRKMNAVEVLLDDDCGNNLQDKEGCTPLHAASRHENLKILRRMLAAGADPCLQDIRGWTPLHLSLESRMQCAAEVLINAINKYDIQDNNGNTPLHIAAKFEFMGIIRKLLAAKADTRVKNSMGWTPLHQALVSMKHYAAETLVDADEKNHVQDNDGKSPLHLAAEYGRDIVVNTLISAGVDPLLQDQRGRTPLHLALAMGNKYAAEKLANVRGKNDIRDKSGETPLFLAAGRGYLNIVRTLLADGANLRIQDEYGWTPLHMAARSSERNGDVVGFLAAAGDDSSIRNDNGDTPLHLAAQSAHLETVRMLLIFDAQPHVYNFDAECPLEIALKRGDEGICKSIISAYAWKDIKIDWNKLNLKPAQIQNCIKMLSECYAEIQQMKSTKVHGTAISYHDLAKRVELYLEDKDIIKALRDTWTNVKNDFPNYATFITYKWNICEWNRPREPLSGMNF